MPEARWRHVDVIWHQNTRTRTTPPHASKDVESLDPSHTAGRSAMWCTALGNNLTASVKMKSNQHMTLPLTPGNPSKSKASSRLHRVLSTSLLAVWFVRVLDRKEPRHPLVSKQPKAYWVLMLGENASQFSSGWMKALSLETGILHLPHSLRPDRMWLEPKIEAFGSYGFLGKLLPPFIPLTKDVYSPKCKQWHLPSAV